MLAHEETHLLRELFCFSPALTRSKSLLFNLLDIAACNYLSNLATGSRAFHLDAQTARFFHANR
jgi:hypothetical protein